MIKKLISINSKIIKFNKIISNLAQIIKCNQVSDRKQNISKAMYKTSSRIGNRNSKI